MNATSYRRAALVLGTVFLLVVPAGATLQLYEDFEAYAVDASINGLGDDWGLERWAAQDSSSIIRDSDHAYVRNINGSRVLELVNRNAAGEIDTVFASMAFASELITDWGTIYMQFKADGPNDMLVGLNGLASGYFGPDANAAGQGLNNDADQGPLWRMSGGEDFRAWSEPWGYQNVAMGQQADEWQELWVQVDVVSQRAAYYVCPLGGEPAPVINPITGGSYWGFRSPQDYLFNIKFFVGGYSGPDGAVETSVLIDNIFIDSENFSTLSPDSPSIPPWPTPLPGDFNGDGMIDIADFVILKNGFGVGTTYREGDADGDGDVDIDDFVIVKNNFGVAAVPEPATMSLSALGGLGLIRRRR